MTETAAQRYTAMVEDFERQHRKSAGAGDRWANRAAVFRLDARRQLEANTAALATLIHASDTIVDVGGGAGRIGLPLALRAKALVNVEPSQAMREQFDGAALEAGITNARAIAGKWPDAAGTIEGDVVIAANVTYFIRDIVPFIEALDRAARRRVVICSWSVPPPDHGARLFELVRGEPFAPLPGHRELLPVLWELGLLPEVRVLPDPFRAGREHPPTREDAIGLALAMTEFDDEAPARAIIESHFDELFRKTDDGYLPTWRPDVREMLITWSKDGSSVCEGNS